MNTKQLAILAITVAAVAKFYGGNETKKALMLGAVAAVAAAVSDNITQA